MMWLVEWKAGCAMKKNRVWMEIVILGTAIAFALALLFATLGAAAGVAEGEVSRQQQMSTTADQTYAGQAYEGMVTCSRCGAKHAASLGQSATTCIRTCVHGGATFALVGADATYLLDGDLNVLKRMAGQRARVVGELHGKTIKISSMAAQT
jgi:hypothetical protein